MTETSNNDGMLGQFIQHAHMESAYQMLLLLLLIDKAEQGRFSLDEAAIRFALFYDLRINAGLSPEKQRKTNVKNFRPIHLRGTIRRQPYPILSRAGLLSFEETQNIFTVSSPVQDAVAHTSQKERIRALAVGRLAMHYQEPEAQIDDLVRRSIEAQEIE
jgi:hypothetical protein